jgi:uncharacterized protein YifN (PemK superfamily)
MPLIYQPRLGAVLRCDFTSMGWMKPEMVKHRDVVVIARNKKNTKLVTVVPLSTTEPKTIEAYHPQLSQNPRPDGDPNTAVWAKCDMVYTVSIDRLDFYYKSTRRGRESVTRSVSPVDLQSIKNGVAAALGLASSPQVPPVVAIDQPPKLAAAAEHSKLLSLPSKTTQTTTD